MPILILQRRRTLEPSRSSRYISRNPIRRNHLPSITTAPTRRRRSHTRRPAVTQTTPNRRRTTRQPGIMLSSSSDLRLNLEPLHQRGMGFLQRPLDETRHDEMARHIHILADVQPRQRCPDAELDWFDWFAGEGAV